MPTPPSLPREALNLSCCKYSKNYLYYVQCLDMSKKKTELRLGQQIKFCVRSIITITIITIIIIIIIIIITNAFLESSPFSLIFVKKRKEKKKNTCFPSWHQITCTLNKGTESKKNFILHSAIWQHFISIQNTPSLTTAFLIFFFLLLSTFLDFSSWIWFLGLTPRKLLQFLAPQLHFFFSFPAWTMKTRSS